MTEAEILEKVAELTTGRKIRDIIVPLRNRSWLQKLYRAKPYRIFELYPSVTGNMIRIAGRALHLPTEIFGNNLYEIALPLIAQHADDLIYIVAAGIQNTREEPSPRLISFIRDNFTSEMLYDTLVPILEGVGMQDFINSTILIKGTDAILKPRVDPMDGSGLIASHNE